jgi:uncharacterized protein YggE
MNLETTETEYEKTMQRAEKMIDALRAAVVSVGHDGKELKTADFNIDTAYESYKEREIWKKRFIGYKCSHKLKLEFDLDMQKLGATLGAIAKCGAVPNFNIKFTVKDPNAISERLLESAVENAKRKAVILAKAAGVTLGEIQHIDYNWSELYMYSESDMSVECIEVAKPADSRFSDIEPEDIKLNDTVTIVWAIE